MSYLAQGLSQGFNAGFAGYNLVKDRKRREQERAEDIAFRQARARIEDEFRDTQLANRGAEFAARQAIEDERLRMDAERFNFARDTDARDYGFRRERASVSDVDRALDRERQKRLDEAAGRLDPLREQILAQQARELQLRNDALADPKPKPIQAVERWEYDPLDPSAPPKRTITGPAGSLGAFTGAAPTGDGATYRSTDDVAAAYRAGRLTREEAAKILQTQFGIDQ